MAATRRRTVATLVRVLTAAHPVLSLAQSYQHLKYTSGLVDDGTARPPAVYPGEDPSTAGTLEALPGSLVFAESYVGNRREQSLALRNTGTQGVVPGHRQ